MMGKRGLFWKAAECAEYIRQASWMFSWIRGFILTGSIVGEQFCYHDLPEKLEIFDYKSFMESPMEFYVGCSNVETGKAEYLRIRDMKKEIDLLRASASLPYASRMVRVKGKKLLDGGCTDSIPVKAFRDMGFTKTVVVLTQHNKGYWGIWMQ